MSEFTLSSGMSPSVQIVIEPEILEYRLASGASVPIHPQGEAPAIDMKLEVDSSGASMCRCGRIGVAG